MSHKDVLTDVRYTPIYMHVNFLENVFTLEDIMRICSETGYDGIELRAWDITRKKNISEYLLHAFAMAKRYKLGLVFGCSNDLSIGADTERKQALNEFKDIISFVSRHNISMLNVFGSPLCDDKFQWYEFHGHGSACATEKQWELTTDYFYQAGRYAQELGVILCFETHACYIHDLGETAADLIKRIGLKNVSANMDFANIFLNKRNQGIDREIEHLQGNIGYVHLKNVFSLMSDFGNPAYWVTPLSNGMINNLILLRKLFAAGYRGILTIENSAAGDKRQLLVDDLLYTRQLLATVQKELEKSVH